MFLHHPRLPNILEIFHKKRQEEHPDQLHNNRNRSKWSTLVSIASFSSSSFPQLIRLSSRYSLSCCCCCCLLYVPFVLKHFLFVWSLFYSSLFWLQFLQPNNIPWTSERHRRRYIKRHRRYIDIWYNKSKWLYVISN